MDFPCMPNNRKLMLHFLDQRYVSDQNDYKPLIKSRLLSSRIECHKQDILYYWNLKYFGDQEGSKVSFQKKESLE